MPATLETRLGTELRHLPRRRQVEDLFDSFLQKPAWDSHFQNLENRLAQFHEGRPLNRAVPFQFAFLSAFSVPRSMPLPSDARSPFQNALRASSRCGLLPQNDVWSAV